MKRPFETELNNAGAPNASETVKSEAADRANDVADDARDAGQHVQNG